MISVGIYNGARPTGARRRLPRYRLFALVVGICLAVITGSHFSHGSHDQQPTDVQKRGLFDVPRGINDSLVSLPHELVSRAADAALWDKKVRSGRGIWCKMNRDDVEPGTVTREKLVSIGWDDEEDEVLAKKWRVPLARADGLLNTANEVPRVWYHENDWTGDDGRARTRTLAMMGNMVNGDDGYIIAGDNYGPAATTKGMKPEVPEWMWPTTKWTDIMAVMWDQHAAGKDLKRVYRSGIATSQTKDLMASAMLKVNRLPSGDLDDLAQWPGVDFVPGDDPLNEPLTPQAEAFFGLLGSSHAAGPAFLGVYYRAIFGKKRINRIKIWRSPTKPAPNMLLYMEDL